jgi:hypothetical protein
MDRSISGVKCVDETCAKNDDSTKRSKSDDNYLRSVHTVDCKQQIQAVLWIRIRVNAAWSSFVLGPDPDIGSQTIADPDPVQTLPYLRYYVGTEAFS